MGLGRSATQSLISTEEPFMTTSTLVVKDLTIRGFRFKESLGRWDVTYSPYLFISPFFILFALVGLFPLLYTGWVSLHAWDLLGGQGISRDLYAAAAIDGAGWVSRFFRVTLPQLRPTLIFVIITATIGGLQIFDEPRLYDQNGLGGEDQQWMTMTIYLYKLGWPQLNFGRAAAVAWLLFLLIIAIGLVNLAITRRIATSEGRTA